MPYKNYNQDMNTYMKSRYFRRREQAIESLGGKCVVCGSVEELEFDHVDPSTKSFSIAKAFSGWSWSRIQVELDKCQLLCRDCHKVKTYGCVAQQ